MGKFYLVSGLGAGFDGLIIEGNKISVPEGLEVVEVEKILDRSIVTGDRNVVLSFPPGGLFIGCDHLDQVDDPGIMEFAYDNPYGKFLLEGRMDCGDLRVTYAQFEKAMTVTVLDTQANRTVISENFSKDFDAVKAAIEDVLKNGGQEDLVFKLRELKEIETNG